MSTQLTVEPYFPCFCFPCCCSTNDFNKVSSLKYNRHMFRHIKVADQLQVTRGLPLVSKVLESCVVSSLACLRRGCDLGYSYCNTNKRTFDRRGFDISFLSLSGVHFHCKLRWQHAATWINGASSYRQSKARRKKISKKSQAKIADLCLSGALAGRVGLVNQIHRLPFLSGTELKKKQQKSDSGQVEPVQRWSDSVSVLR